MDDKTAFLARKLSCGGCANVNEPFSGNGNVCRLQRHSYSSSICVDHRFFFSSRLE